MIGQFAKDIYLATILSVKVNVSALVSIRRLNADITVIELKRSQ